MDSKRVTLMKIILALSASAAILLAACTPAEAPAPTPEPAPVEAPAPEPTPAPVAAPTIVELAAGNADLSTLVTAVTAAGLVETLSGPGPFTVFAPPNAAFAALPAGTVESLLLPENSATLGAVLTYHVVAGEVMAADLIAAITAGGGTHTITTVQGGTLTASIVEGGVVLTDAKGGTAKVVATDIDASNGVVHVIDAVVLPQ
jgi:uncharacterized surface protein with fasciclin (FAS1) repeats